MDFIMKYAKYYIFRSTWCRWRGCRELKKELSLILPSILVLVWHNFYFFFFASTHCTNCQKWVLVKQINIWCQTYAKIDQIIISVPGIPVTCFWHYEKCNICTIHEEIHVFEDTAFSRTEIWKFQWYAVYFIFCGPDKNQIHTGECIFTDTVLLKMNYTPRHQFIERPSCQNFVKGLLQYFRNNLLEN